MIRVRGREEHILTVAVPQRQGGLRREYLECHQLEGGRGEVCRVQGGCVCSSQGCVVNVGW